MEWKRIFWSRKGIYLLLFLLFANGVTFYHYLQHDSDEFMIGKEEYEKYIRDYPETVKKIMDNGKRLAAFAVFREKDSFARTNIEKTGRDYGRVKDVRPVRLDHPEVAALFSYEWVHLYVFIFGIWMVFVFMSGRKGSMDILVHACKNGRAYLFLVRSSMLFLCMIACSFLLYLSMYGIVVWKYGLESLRVPVQSLPVLEKVTFPVSIVQFMFIALGVQVSGSILAVLVFWLISVRIPSAEIGMGAYIILLVTEYILYSSVGLQSNLCFLRYVNVLFCLNVTELWESYFNVRVGGSTVSHVFLFLCFVCVFLTVIYMLLLLSAVRGYPVTGKGFITKLLEKVIVFIRKKMAGLPVVFWELYKLLWCQRGIVVFLLFVWILWGTMDDSQMFFTAEQEYLNAFFEDNEGIVTEEKLKKMEGDPVLQKQYEHVRAIMSAGREIWLVNERGYEVLIGEEADRQRNADGFMAGVSLLLMLSGCFTYEKKSGMVPLLRGAKRGQGWLFRRKHMVADLLTLVVCGTMVMAEWKRVTAYYTLHCLAAPVQSLPFLSGLTLPVTIGGYLVMMAVAEYLILYTFKNLILCFSVLCTKVQLVVLAGDLFLITNVWMKTLIVTSISTDASLYFRCVEMAVLVVGNICLLRIGKKRFSSVACGA